MIRREVMEAHFPDFVKKLDKELAEATEFNKEICPVIPRRKKARANHTTPPAYLSRIAILAVIKENGGPMKLSDIYDKLASKWAYHTVTNNVLRLMEVGELERVSKAMYAIKRHPSQESS